MSTVGAWGRARRSRRALAVWVGAVGMSACAASSNSPPASPTAPAAPGGAAARPYGPDLAPVATSIDPCEDFEGFACEGRPTPWTRMKRPGDALAHWPEGITRFADEVVAGQHQELLTTSPLLREYLARCRDPGARDAGLAELARHLDAFARVTTLEEWVRALGHLRSLGFPIFLDFTRIPIEVEGKKTGALRIGLSAPILPYRFYRPVHWAVHENYAHWQRLAKLTGMATEQDVNQASRVDRWLALERPARPGVVNRGPITRADLERWRFPWRAYLEALGVPVEGPFMLDEPGDLDHVDTALALPLDVLKSYVRILLIERWAEYVGPELLAEEIQFHFGRVRDLVVPVVALREECEGFIVHDFSQMLWMAYDWSQADRANEANATALFGVVRERLLDRIRRATLADGTVRAQVGDFVAKLKPLFAEQWSRPPVWSAVALQPGSFLDIIVRLRTEATRRELLEIGHAWTGGEKWDWPPGNVPAALLGARAEIFFSAGMVMPPYLRGPPWPAATYGGLGAIIGHELAHSLPGALRFVTSLPVAASSPSAAAREDPFECLGRHFSRIASEWNVKFDPRRSAEEYTADLTGLDLALEALRVDRSQLASDPDSYWQHVRELFVASAQAKCSAAIDFVSEIDTRRDQHPSMRVRVNGVVSELPEFARAFGCVAGQPMAPAQRCVAW